MTKLLKNSIVVYLEGWKPLYSPKGHSLNISFKLHVFLLSIYLIFILKWVFLCVPKFKRFTGTRKGVRYTRRHDCSITNLDTGPDKFGSYIEGYLVTVIVNWRWQW